MWLRCADSCVCVCVCVCVRVRVRVCVCACAHGSLVARLSCCVWTLEEHLELPGPELDDLSRQSLRDDCHWSLETALSLFERIWMQHASLKVA